MEKIYKFQNASSLICDIRDFTGNFKKFQKLRSDVFLKFTESILQNGLDLTDMLSRSNEYHFSSTGDGFLVIFSHEDCEKTMFLLGILLHHTMKGMCQSFHNDFETKVSFGIGIESGNVQEISAKSGQKEIKTYLGNVINIASRIESETKTHTNSNLIIGQNINNTLCYKLYDLNYDLFSKQISICTNARDRKEIIEKLLLYNHKMLLTFLFEHNLKGVDDPVELLRFSPSFAKYDKVALMELLKILSFDEKEFNIVKEIMGINELEV
jgi:hypothetical protein